MRALLLAAGFGSRLRPLTDHTPKCLIPIHGQPLLSLWFDMLLPAGFDRLLVNTHYLADSVHAFVAASPWHGRVDLVHEEALLGTGGTVLRNRNFFQDAPFLVVHADNLTRFDVAAFVSVHRHRPPGAEITMMTFETDRPETCGIVETDRDGLVVGFHEKSANPPGNRANAAVYIFEPSIIDFLLSFGKDVIDLSTEVLPRYLGRIGTFHNDDYHRDIGTPESLAAAHREFKLRPPAVA